MEATVAAGKYKGSCKFTAPHDSVSPGKQVTNSKTRAELGWEPKYPSFLEFMAGGACDWFSARDPHVQDTRPSGRSGAGWVELVRYFASGGKGDKLFYYHSETGEIRETMPEGFEAP